MNPIGGYFELETGSSANNLFHSEAINLNTARNAFEYVLRAREARVVYLPHYICSVMLEPIKKLKIKPIFYKIDQNLEPQHIPDNLDQDTCFLFVNYFGLKDLYINSLKVQSTNIIIDNSQAFFSMSQPTVDRIYSPRKFFGVPDGAHLYTSHKQSIKFARDLSWQRCTHLLRRLDDTPEAGYQDYQNADLTLQNQPIMKMSRLTEQLLKKIDYVSAKKSRQNNFKYLSRNLESINQLKFAFDGNNVPLTYPLLVKNGFELRQHLISKRIFCPVYWPSLAGKSCNKSIEKDLQQNLVCLPIDQRYNKNDMKIILREIETFKRVTYH
jgi:hypothetical protein